MADYTGQRLYETENTEGHPTLQQIPQLWWELCGKTLGHQFN
jgi:hypothetical protein